MAAQDQVRRSKGLRRDRAPWIFWGIVLMLIVIGAGGCGSGQANAPSPANQTTGAQQADQGQRLRNPAVQAAMEIRLLQRNPDLALNSDQKNKIKPILQKLINTSYPTQDFLQQQADAINAVLTAEQRNYLAESRQNPRRNQGGSGPNSSSANSHSADSNSANSHSADSNSADSNSANSHSADSNSVNSSDPNRNGQGGNPNNNRNGRAFQPQDIYRQVLDSLN